MLGRTKQQGGVGALVGATIFCAKTRSLLAIATLSSLASACSVLFDTDSRSDADGSPGNDARQVADADLTSSDGSLLDAQEPKPILSTVIEDRTESNGNAAPGLYLGKDITAFSSVVGLRFNGLEIPVNSSFTFAELVFRPLQGNSETGIADFTIRGVILEDDVKLDNSSLETLYAQSPFPEIAVSDNNDSANPPWGTSSEAPAASVVAFSELQPLLNALVASPSWSEANPNLVFLIKGDGRRIAQSLDENPTLAATLNAEFVPSL